MSTTDSTANVTPEPMEEFDAATAAAERRVATIAGLRQIAGFLERHPELPTPYVGSLNAFVQDKADLARVARVAGVSWKKRATPDFFALSQAFAGDITYEINVSREQVCRKVVTGTRIEPAQPEREVEEFHWVCEEPLLAGVK